MKKKNLLTVLLTAGMLAAAALQVSAEEPETVTEVMVTESGDDTGTVEIVAEGTCGTSITWKLDNIGTLTLDGSGTMPAWYSRPKWFILK